MTDDPKPTNSTKASLQQLSQQLIPDVKLREKLLQPGDQVHTLIVEAALPKRTFELRDAQSKTLTPTKPGHDSESRDRILDRLSGTLAKIAGKANINLLKTSGAIVIRVDSKQLAEVLRTENVKAIRENRSIPPIRRSNDCE